MAVSRDKINRAYSLLKAMGGINASSDFSMALAIVKKVSEIESSEENRINDSDLFSLMLHVADMFGVLNPFVDRKSFLNIYYGLREFGEISWAEIIKSVDGKRMPKFIVPVPLIDEMEKNFCDGYQKVLIVEAEKFSEGLEHLVEAHPDCHFTLTTMLVYYQNILKEMFCDNEMVDVQIANIYQYGFATDKYDLILSVPVFSGRYKAGDDPRFISRESEMIALENLALHLKSDGILSIVMPSRITFAGGDVKEVRNFIQSMYCLKEIADLPSGIFEYTGLRTCLLTITTGRTDEVSIKRYTTDTENPRKEGFNKLIVSEDTFVVEDELTDIEDWNIDRVLESQDKEWLEFQASDVKKQDLGSVASIFRGKAITTKDPNGSIGVINISNIGEYEVDYSTLEHIEEEERKISNYILKTGDLLIPARGTVIRVAIFEEQSYTCIASSNVVVIRITDNSLNPVYLKLFFDTPLGRKMLISRQQGTTVMNISYKELNNIEVPMPAEEEQNAIAEEYLKELKTYSEAIHQAENRWNAALARLQERI